MSATKKKKTKQQTAGYKQMPVVAPRPTCPNLSRVLGLSAEPELLQGSAEYRRRDEMEVVVPEKSILTELTNQSVLNTRRSYYIGWSVPDVTKGRGTLLALHSFSVELYNEGVYDLNVVAEQPHGYEASPSSIAAWVLLFNKGLKSGERVRITIRPVDNNFVVPFRQEMGGMDCVVVMAMSVARQAMAQGFTSVSGAEVGLRLKTEAHYDASGNDLTDGSFFAFRTISNDAAMFAVEEKPPVPVTVSSLFPGALYMQFSKTADSVIYATLVVVKEDGKKEMVNDGWSLDKTRIYRLPVSFIVVNNDPIVAERGSAYASYIGFHNNNWCVSCTPKQGTCGPPNDPLPNKLYPIVSNDMFLYPVKDSAVPKKLFVRNTKISGKLMQCVSVPHGRLSAGPLGDFKDTALTAISFIVSVIKVSSAVAGALGLLNTVDCEDDWEITN